MRDSGKRGYRQILVGRFFSNMAGLDEIFDALYAEGRAPEEDLGSELVKRARVYNYIPRSAESEYAAALLREYRKYWRDKKQGKVSCGCASSRPTWHGIPREEIAWFPILDDSLCDGCGKCVSFCPEKVFEFTEDGSKVYIASPFDCQVGCSSCERICPRKAIAFPPREMLERMTRH